MPNKLYREPYVQAIAEAIRLKTGKNNSMTISEMANEIEKIAVSGDNVEIKLQDKTITENGTYTADSGYNGLGTVTVNVEKGGDAGSTSDIFGVKTSFISKKLCYSRLTVNAEHELYVIQSGMNGSIITE